MFLVGCYSHPGRGDLVDWSDEIYAPSVNGSERVVTATAIGSWVTLPLVTDVLEFSLHGLHAREVAAAAFNFTSTPGNKEIMTLPQSGSRLDVENT